MEVVEVLQARAGRRGFYLPFHEMNLSSQLPCPELHPSERCCRQDFGPVGNELNISVLREVANHLAFHHARGFICWWDGRVPWQLAREPAHRDAPQVEKRLGI